MKAERGMPDVPKTRAEYWRQKGPVPLIAIFMAIALAVVFILFFLPALISSTASN